MSKLERTVKDLIIFYVKENYNKYLSDNNLTIIEKEKNKEVISDLYYSKKDHLKQFVKDSLKELWKDDYPGDLVINNIFFEIYEDDALCINRICVEIELYQDNEK
tara:strand:- start:53 stop:367 length:315 start_codon:yes stop_codon:yes gene_type:complete